MEVPPPSHVIIALDHKYFPFCGAGVEVQPLEGTVVGLVDTAYAYAIDEGIDLSPLSPFGIPKTMSYFEVPEVPPLIVAVGFVPAGRPDADTVIPAKVGILKSML